jgi:hypothetical protein
MQKQVENVLRRYIGTGSPFFYCIATLKQTSSTRSGIRHLQDVQITRYPANKGDAYLLHDLRILWLPTFRQRYQEWFPGPSHQEEQKQNRIIHVRNGFFLYLAPSLCRNPSLQFNQ